MQLPSGRVLAVHLGDPGQPVDEDDGTLLVCDGPLVSTAGPERSVVADYGRLVQASLSVSDGLQLSVGRWLQSMC